jgi:NAD(P)H-dependent FMN reductase
MQIRTFAGSTRLESLNRKLASPAAALLKNTIDWVAARLAP